jgi:hypothetical protein
MEDGLIRLNGSHFLNLPTGAGFAPFAFVFVQSLRGPPQANPFNFILHGPGYGLIVSS